MKKSDKNVYLITGVLATSVILAGCGGGSGGGMGGLGATGATGAAGANGLLPIYQAYLMGGPY